MISILNKEYPRIESLLKGEIKNFYLTCSIADLYTESKSDEEASGVDSFIKSHSLILTPEGLKYIDQHKDIANDRQIESSSLKSGDSAPGFDLKDLTGKNHKLSEFRGKIIYLHFWATWCGLCLGELSNTHPFAVGDKVL